MKRPLTLLLLCLLTLSILLAQPARRPQHRNLMRETRAEFFQTDDARRIGDHILAYQRVTGGWPKNIDMAQPLSTRELDEVRRDKQRTDDSTIDNAATTTQMTFLARLYEQTGDEQYREGFLRGLEYLLSGQYDDGGWPQFWPNPHGYQVHITYNDNNIANTLRLFQQLIDQKSPYGGNLVDDAMRQRLQTSFDKGIECILRTQIVVKGKPTVWCQQHYQDSYAPAPARAFELPSYCSAESAGLTSLLMTLPNPDKRVKAAVHGAMKWFDTYKLTGLRIERTGSREDLQHQDTRLVSAPNARPLWARFYDLERCEPFVCDRDGIPRRHLEEIGYERRNGYGWYNESAAPLYAQYEEWASKYDPKHKVKISLETKGANENGTIEMFRQPVHLDKDYDAVVRPGESIQNAISHAPAQPTEPYKIYIHNGIYREKVIIDRPNIVLVGEDRDSTRLILAETAKTQTIREWNGQPVGNGVIVLQEGADDCVISGLTVYNDYGTTVDPGNTTHQMAIYGRGTRTIVINCNVWADGNDALSLWAPESAGMYYHADLWLRCPGVDFLCPRGWCYATRCHFYGDSRAMIWHDGRGDKSKKLVITNSEFDAKSPTKLGRWHHDSQFFLVNCRMSENVLDSNIQYAYSDKVLDPCPWGERVYYLNCSREGGHSGWLNDNIMECGERLYYHSTTATWTFGGKWDPEQHIRDLWKWLAY